MSQKAKVINLYKTLLHLGRDWPQGFDHFRPRLKKAFLKNREVTETDQIETLLKHGEFVVKEIETLYMLKKYRTLKRSTWNVAFRPKKDARVPFIGVSLRQKNPYTFTVDNFMKTTEV